MGRDNPPGSGRFDVVAVDPPWSYGSKTEARTVRYATQLASTQYEVVGSDRGTEVNRRTGEGIENIAALIPMDDLVSPSSALFLWTTNPKLPFAFSLMEAWGFTYKTTLTWVKITKAEQVMVGGMGWFFRGATEHVLFGTRGNYGIPAELRRPNVFYAQRGRHSEKPQEFYDLVEAVTPGQARLDCFARRWRSGWWAWGDEVGECHTAPELALFQAPQSGDIPTLTTPTTSNEERASFDKCVKCGHWLSTEHQMVDDIPTCTKCECGDEVTNGPSPT
jgi:N6-adenosine-specific RNA methylase IME4